VTQGPITDSPPATARDMLALLRRHYLPDESRSAGIFAPEIQAPGPTLRKADLIWLGCTAASHELVGHEIKVSRADVLVELADLTKTDPWQRYCDRWWLAIPDPALIAGLQLPDSWGVLTPPSGRRTRSMTVHRPAPVLRPAEQSPALRTLAAWTHWRLRDTQSHLEGSRERARIAETELQELRLRTPRVRDPERDIVTRIVQALGGQHGGRVGGWEQQVSVDDVVLALKDLGEVYARRDQAAHTLERTRGQLEVAQRVIARTLEEMDGAKNHGTA
jgi:hypothetical protein